MQEPSSSNKGLVFGTIAVAVLIFTGLVWAILSAPPSIPTGETGPEAVTFNDADIPFQGNPDAKVVVHIYSDFQCPACRAQEPAISYAVEHYSDQVKFIWKDFPLSSIHPNARAAANAAWCASEQEKYWEYHDTLYNEQNSWSSLPDPKESFQAYATRVGMDTDAFTSCYDARTYDAKISASVQEGTANRVQGTPTIFVNKVRHPGLNPVDWDRVLQAALAEAGTPVVATPENP
jgi:protein-disulfide isomerase